MSMKMGWRWYGEGNDPITLSDIKQIPGVEEIVWALHSKMPGEIWEEAEIKEVVDQIHAAGFDATVVESVNVHDDIKIGLPTRDKYIENYKQCIRNLSKFGVKTICYNFMPIFDWTRTDLFHPVGDGSTALFYQKDLIQDDYKGWTSCSRPTPPSPRRSCGTTSNTSSRPSCPPAASATSRWRSIRTIPHGTSSACPVCWLTPRALIAS